MYNTLLKKIVKAVSGSLEQASVAKVEKASNLNVEQKIEGLIKNYCIERASDGSVSMKPDRAKEIAEIVVEDITIWLKSDKTLSDIAEVRNIKMGDTRKVSLNYPFKAATVNADGTGFFQTPETKSYSISTDMIDVSANVSIFRLIQGMTSVKEIYEQMRVAMMTKQLSLVLGVIITAIGTTGDDYQTYTDADGLKSGLVAAMNFLSDRGIDIRGMLGYKSVISRVNEIDGYSDKYLEMRDNGSLGTFRGVMLWGIVKPLDKDGNTIFPSSFDNVIAVIGSKGLYVAIENTSHAFDQYDLVQKQHLFNMFQEFGALAISNRNAIVKGTIA